MPKKRLVNDLKWSADLLKLGETIDPDTDRPVKGYPKVRDIKYRTLGVTSTDKMVTLQDKNEVTKKIEVRLDRAIENNQKDYRIKISEAIYNIERVYVKEDDRRMEVSLSYVD